METNLAKEDMLKNPDICLIKNNATFNSLFSQFIMYIKKNFRMFEFKTIFVFYIVFH